MFCTICYTPKAHNGLCADCASLLRAEYDEQTAQLEAARYPLWHDARARAITAAQLADYDNPAVLPYEQREVAKLLSHNYDTRSWA